MWDGNKVLQDGALEPIHTWKSRPRSKPSFMSLFHFGFTEFFMINVQYFGFVYLRVSDVGMFTVGQVAMLLIWMEKMNEPVHLVHLIATVHHQPKAQYSTRFFLLSSSVV